MFSGRRNDILEKIQALVANTVVHCKLRTDKKCWEICFKGKALGKGKAYFLKQFPLKIEGTPSKSLGDSFTF